MPRHHAIILAVCFAMTMTPALAGCSTRCPNGSGLLDGKCVPIQQNAGRGAIDERELETTPSSASGQAAPGANSGTARSSGPAVNNDGASVGAGGASAKQPAMGTNAMADAGSPPAECSPADELCDNLDNDCDGKIDENVTRACQDLPTPCQPGVLSCHEGAWDDEETQCQGAIGPTEEVCDDSMLDEDCNGVANEGCACIEGETRACGRSEGVCRPGTQRCTGGMWTMECEGAVGNPEEGCECMSGTSEMCSAGRGVCASGERQCEAGMWSPCMPLEPPSPEVCDNQDNDCNGIVDGPTATCGNPDEKCVAPGRCAQCTTDRDCGKLTTGCEVGKCKSGSCGPEPLEEYAACTSGATRGYCVDNACTAPRNYRIEDGDGDVKYSGNWDVAGSVHYAKTAGAYFLVHFVGTKATLFGGRGPDRGAAEYSVCNSTGTGCNSTRPQSNYAATLSVQRLWTSPTLPFGEHTLKGRVTGQAEGATDTIVDIDYVDVN